MRGHKIYRSVFIWPYAIAAPALGLAFRFILAPEAGLLSVINQVWPGLWNPALDGKDAMIAVIVAFSWKYIGYNFIFFLSALQGIPRSLIEAAAMDGSGPMRRIWDIQLPLLTPTLFFLLVINITESFQDSFGIVDIMTAGWPGARDRADGLQDLFRRLQRPRLFRCRRPVDHPDDPRRPPHHRPVPLHRAARALQVRRT
jgi:sn-glycerol 3-phosphate transport system permease protein